MTARPWMPLYIADYLADTSHLGALQSGAYLHLIMHYWQHDGLPSGDAALARIARLTAAEWKREHETLAAFFHDGWRHKRIDAELSEATEKHERRVEAGKRGGKSKAEAKQKPSIATSNAPSNTLASSSQPQPEKVAAQPSARAAENSDIGKPITPPSLPIILRRGERDRDWFEQIEVEMREAAGLEDDPSPALFDTSPMVTLLDQGYDFARDILPKLRAAKASGKRGRTWAYYVPAITEGKAANGKIAPKTTLSGRPPDVWITEDDPRWPAVSDRWREARGKPPPILDGKQGNIGRGWHFPPDMVSPA